MAKTPSHQGFEKKFWSQLSRQYWEQKPVAIKNVISPIRDIDADQIFQLLLRYSDHCRETNTADGVKFYVEGHRQYPDEVIENLPVAEDESLLGYHARMRALYPDYCLVCDELIQVSQEKWELLGSFMDGLYQHVGVPNRYAEIGLYLGNYRKTPFGVHVDGCGVLSLPVVGTKKFRLWDPEYVAKNPELKESFSYPDYLKKSKLLVANPGDVTYWPSSYWHIAESDGSFSATWSIGVWMDRSFADLLSQTLKPLWVEKLGRDADARTIRSKPAAMHRADGCVEELPEIFERAIQMLKRIPERELRECLLRHWLELCSKRGFKQAPMLESRERLLSADQLRKNSAAPILWIRLSNGKIGLALNGRLVEAPGSDRVIKLLKSINAGEAVEIKSRRARPEANLLEMLYRAHRLSKI